VQELAKAAYARGVDAGEVAAEQERARLVEDHPVADPVTEGTADRVDELAEPADHVAVRPAAALLEHLGEVPVVEGDPRFDTVLEAAVDHPAVEVEAGLVDTAEAVGEHPWPGDGEPLGVEAEIGDDAGVGVVAVVEVACFLAV